MRSELMGSTLKMSCKLKQHTINLGPSSIGLYFRIEYENSVRSSCSIDVVFVSPSKCLFCFGLNFGGKNWKQRIVLGTCPIYIGLWLCQSMTPPNEYKLLYRLCQCHFWAPLCCAILITANSRTLFYPSRSALSCPHGMRCFKTSCKQMTHKWTNT